MNCIFYKMHSVCGSPGEIRGFLMVKFVIRSKFRKNTKLTIKEIIN